VSGRRMSTPSTSPAKHGPTWRMEMVMTRLLFALSFLLPSSRFHVPLPLAGERNMTITAPR
jgi:hypothetical protein